MMNRRGNHENAHCPRCGSVEDSEHVWTCHGNTQELWDRSMKSLKEFLVALDTPPEMMHGIIRSLTAWRNGDTPPIPSTPWIARPFIRQQHFGWRNFFEGIWDSSWRETQALFLKRRGSRRSPKRWASAVIRKLWDIAWDLWEH